MVSTRRTRATPGETRTVFARRPVFARVWLSYITSPIRPASRAEFLPIVASESHTVGFLNATRDVERRGPCSGASKVIDDPPVDIRAHDLQVIEPRELQGEQGIDDRPPLIAFRRARLDE